jgi:hypothetical protein
MWAGYLALTNEQYLENGSKTTLGFINPALYAIGESSSYTTDFHDITSSSNGSNGFTCVTGYNLCGGWGSPNGDNLINALAVVTSNPSFTVSASPTKITIAKGASGTVTITTTVSGGFDSAITLTATGQGSKQTVTFSPNPIPAPGSGTSTMTIKVGSTATTGNKKITITATGGGLSLTTTVTLDVIN